MAELSQEEHDQLLATLDAGYMIVETRTVRFFVDVGEGRRLAQEWESSRAISHPWGETAIGIIRFEDLSGSDCRIRTDEILGMWESNGKLRAMERAINEHLDTEKKAAKKNWDET